jgi:lysozyme
MNPSAQCVTLVKHFEGLFLKAYLCPAKVWTIGYGHTGLKHNDGTVKRGRKITSEQADVLLAADLTEKYAPDVRKLVKVPLKQHEFDALVSFHFNTGALGKSTLLKKLNQMDKGGAALEFMKWTRGGGKVLPGLVRRRKAEQYLFNTGRLAFEFA